MLICREAVVFQSYSRSVFVRAICVGSAAKNSALSVTARQKNILCFVSCVCARERARARVCEAL